MLEYSGNIPSVRQQTAKLLYWMQERERIRELKEADFPKPWSEDVVFQQTYFCNVHREDDRVTRYIRTAYSSSVGDGMFEVNIGFTRFINRPETLEYIGYLNQGHAFERVSESLQLLQREGKTVFGDAYIVSTNGRAIGKAQYIAEWLLPALYKAVGPTMYPSRYAGSAPTLAAHYRYLTGIYGIGSFMAGQILADLKNTPGHPLYTAEDRHTWACHGPGSLRGLSWIYGHDIKQGGFRMALQGVRELLAEQQCDIELDNQDLQNCMCEFDKYCRVSTGSGRSKRRYPGA